MDPSSARSRFAELHRAGTFAMPNAWDVGSALLLQRLGAPAVATTSSGHALTLGREDQQVTRGELLAHVEVLVAAVDVPVSVDAERCFAEDPAGVAETVRLVARAGAAGVSIEDYDPASGAVDDLPVAVERVRAAADAAHESALLLTARAEQHLYVEGADLSATVERLVAFRGAGADCLYAPGLTEPDDIARVVAEVDAPVNVLALPAAPGLAALAGLGVRRVSTGGALAKAAYAEAEQRARAFLEG